MVTFSLSSKGFRPQINETTLFLRLSPSNDYNNTVRKIFTSLCKAISLWILSESESTTFEGPSFGTFFSFFWVFSFLITGFYIVITHCLYNFLNSESLLFSTL